jgi:hypothetical protein
MLGLPTSGFARSVNKDNVSLFTLCDWIESSLLFSGESISQRDVIDILCENGIYAEQDMASTKMEDVWSILKWRVRTLGQSSPFEIIRTRLKVCVDSWEEAPAQAFCLMLSMPKLYKAWSNEITAGYNDQGMLFELLSKEAIEAKFSGWKVELTGWSKTKPDKLPAVVKNVAQLINEPVGDLSTWSDGDENEAGLDLLCVKTFGDSRGCLPAFFFQCASGSNWKNKLKTPDLSIWRRFITFSVQELPRKGFTLPYAFSEGEFLRTANRTEGLLLDRYRLIAMPDSSPDWTSTQLRDNLIKWCKPLVASLPELHEEE